MKKRILFTLLNFVLLSFISIGQTGNGHDPSVVLSYTPSGYSTATYMRQDKSYLNEAKNTLNNRSTCTLFVNFIFDTSGKNVYLVYTTDGTAPTKTNGASVSCSFSNYNDPNRTWVGELPSSAHSGGTAINYVFYISDSDLASAWGRVAGSTGYTTSWTEGDDYYSYVVRYTNVSGGGNWSSTTTWQSGSVPNSASTPVEIMGSSTVSLDQDVSTQLLLINSDGKLVINAGKSLTVNGTLTNNAGNAGLVINSDATGTGSLIFQSGTPAATVQRYLTTYTTNDNGWHYLSSPVSGFTISGSDFEPVAGTDDLYRFDETKSSENWLNYDNTSFSETHFQVGEGYLVAYSGATATNPKTFTGNLVSGDQPIYDLSYTSSATYPGWNLFGNPFTSAIDWDLIAKSPNVNGTVYVVKSSDGTNASWNGSAGDLTDGIIPAMQGFFVNTDRTGENIFIPASSQVHNPTSVDYFKSSSKLANQTFKISLSNTDFNNNTYIQFRDDASEAFDNAIDGYKLFGFGTAPEIYTKVDDTDYSINCLSTDVASFDLPLGVKIQHDGVYNLTFVGFSTFGNEVNLTLEDLLTGKTVAINEGSVYTFTHTNGDSEMRFLLHFAGVNGISSPGADAKAAIIYSSNKTILVKSLNNSLNGTVEVVNMMGQVLHVQHVDGASVSINTGLTNGVYIVRYKSDKGALQTDKVILR